MNCGGHRRRWWRIVPLLITPLLLWLVLRGIHFNALASTFRQMNGFAFAAALVLYGVLFVPAAWRWHLVLRLGRQARTFASTLRASLIGHFFYTVFFGVVGGDSAKAVLYARWHRFRPEKILATAPLDRLLGFGGSLLFAAGALVAAWMGRGFEGRLGFSIALSIRWIAAIAIIGILVWACLKRAGQHPLWTGFLSSLRISANALITSPKTVLAGLSCGLLVQVALAAGLGLNLWAVASQPVQWQKLLWTFPVIIALSALPVTVGGLGTREGAATLLWSIYGVAKADAVAAAMLTMVVAVFWAAVAGCLLLVTLITEKTRAGSALHDVGGARAAKKANQIGHARLRRVVALLQAPLPLK